MASLAPVIRQRFFDADGEPLSGGKLYSYVAGTTTPKATYSDSSGSTPNANPVILDSEGYADVWLANSSYKFVLRDSEDVILWTKDNVSVAEGSSSGSGGVGFGAWVPHSVTDGQSATALSGETVDSTVYSSADYIFEITRGTTVFANGSFSLQYLNSSWRIQLGEYRSDIAHGITFTLTGTTTAQLLAAANSGAGNGTVKLSRILIPA